MAKKLKEELHTLVDDLPAARCYLEYLRDLGTDPVLRTANAAPVDDEGETPEEAAAVVEGREAVRRGDVVSDEDVRRELSV